jgi:hypothetical protein
VGQLVGLSQLKGRAALDITTWFFLIAFRRSEVRAIVPVEPFPKHVERQSQALIP